MPKSSCVFCGSADGVEVVAFPVTFTAFQFLQAGDKACERCSVMFRDAKFRRNCWAVKDGQFVVLEDPLGALENLPDPPFVLYFTRQKRKHGWILAVQNPVLSKDKFILVVDEEKILFERAKFEELHALAKEMVERGVPRRALLGGMPWPSVIRKYGLTWPECLWLQRLQKEPLWRTIVEFSRRI